MTSDPAEELSILSISEELVPSTKTIPSQEVILAFNGLLSPPLVLQTNETECGGKLWPAGMVLAEYLLRNKMDEMKGKKMFVCSNVSFLPHAYRNAGVLSRQLILDRIELGAGSGLVGYTYSSESFQTYEALTIQPKPCARDRSQTHGRSTHNHPPNRRPPTASSPPKAQHRSQHAQLLQLDLRCAKSLVVGPGDAARDSQSAGRSPGCRLLLPGVECSLAYCHSGGVDGGEYGVLFLL